MADILLDGDFTRPFTVGAPKYEYPFRFNGDRVSALLEQEYWQLVTTWTPQELTSSHETMPDFYLVKETDPVEFIAGLYRFTRTYARIPTQQTEWSSFLVPMPDPTTGAGRAAEFGLAGDETAPDLANFFNGGILAANWFYGLGTYYRPLKAANAISYVQNSPNVYALTVHVPNHNFTPNTDLVLIRDANTSPKAIVHTLSLVGTNAANSYYQWFAINANYIMTVDTKANHVGAVSYATQANRGSFGTGTRYLRCRRVTDFYLPGVSPGIATEADIPLPADQSGSAEFIDALLAGTGDINVQVGELTRWRNSPIYQITKTVISVVDLL